MKRLIGMVLFSLITPLPLNGCAGFIDTFLGESPTEFNERMAQQRKDSEYKEALLVTAAIKNMLPNYKTAKQDANELKEALSIFAYTLKAQSPFYEKVSTPVELPRSGERIWVRSYSPNRVELYVLFPYYPFVRLDFSYNVETPELHWIDSPIMLGTSHVTLYREGEAEIASAGKLTSKEKNDLKNLGDYFLIQLWRLKGADLKETLYQK